ncbi:hypothetical protein ACSJG8_11875, partial [Klebsiella pneumoniae]
REILISESAWEEMTCLFAPSLDQYQSIKYFIRVFIDRDLKGKVSSNIIKEINNAVMEEVTPS